LSGPDHPAALAELAAVVGAFAEHNDGGRE